MSIKDKVIFGLLGVLLVAGLYFQVMAGDMKSRMSELNIKDTEHLDVIDKEFREGLRQFDLKFEGRGKHIRKAHCLLYTSPSPRDRTRSRMPSSA